MVTVEKKTPRKRAKSKYILLSNMCDICTKPTKFQLVGLVVGSEETKKWAKCSKCRHTVLLDMELIEGPKEETSLGDITADECIPYSPKTLYEIGDAIYHQAWDDMGMVRSKEMTSNGKFAIVVAFMKSGEKN